MKDTDQGVFPDHLGGDVALFLLGRYIDLHVEGPLHLVGGILLEIPALPQDAGHPITEQDLDHVLQSGIGCVLHPDVGLVLPCIIDHRVLQRSYLHLQLVIGITPPGDEGHHLLCGGDLPPCGVGHPLLYGAGHPPLCGEDLPLLYGADRPLLYGEDH